MSSVGSEDYYAQDAYTPAWSSRAPSPAGSRVSESIYGLEEQPPIPDAKYFKSGVFEDYATRLDTKAKKARLSVLREIQIAISADMQGFIKEVDANETQYNSFEAALCTVASKASSEETRSLTDITAKLMVLSHGKLGTDIYDSLKAHIFSGVKSSSSRIRTMGVHYIMIDPLEAFDNYVLSVSDWISKFSEDGELAQEMDETFELIIGNHCLVLGSMLAETDIFLQRSLDEVFTYEFLEAISKLLASANAEVRLFVGLFFGALIEFCCEKRNTADDDEENQYEDLLADITGMIAEDGPLLASIKIGQPQYRPYRKTLQVLQDYFEKLLNDDWELEYEDEYAFTVSLTAEDVPIDSWRTRIFFELIRRAWGSGSIDGALTFSGLLREVVGLGPVLSSKQIDASVKAARSKRLNYRSAGSAVSQRKTAEERRRKSARKAKFNV